MYLMLAFIAVVVILLLIFSNKCLSFPNAANESFILFSGCISLLILIVPSKLCISLSLLYHHLELCCSALLPLHVNKFLWHTAYIKNTFDFLTSGVGMEFKPQIDFFHLLQISLLKKCSIDCKFIFLFVKLTLQIYVTRIYVTSFKSKKDSLLFPDLYY